MSVALPFSHFSHSHIPLQMQCEDLLFVLISAGEKGIREKGWNLVSHGRRFNDPELIAHLQRGGNYGYYPAPGSCLLSLDVDDAEVFHAAGGADITAGTFSYSAWTDRHKYRAIVCCPDIPGHFCGHKLSIRDYEYQTIVELFFPANREKTGGQCIGPCSLHPNGNRYEIFDPDAPILTVHWSAIENLVRTISPDTMSDTIPDTIPEQMMPVSTHGTGKTITQRYGLSVMNNLPEQARIARNEIRGVHPVHGSTSPGGNVSMNPSKGLVYCFRCAAGYDAAGWDAICRGILPCGGTYDTDVMKRHVDLLNTEMPEVRFLEKIAWKRSRRRQ